jgi:DNA polymerase-1
MPATRPRPLLLADVPWLLYRSYFALPRSIAGSDGHPVNALLGTVNAILAVIDAYPTADRPRAVVACMGAEQAAYRVALYPPYHAHRDEMPPELAAQWTKAPALLESLGWLVASTDELEADDVMHSYALAERERGGRALIYSGDRDMYGAVGEKVAVVELTKGSRPVELGPREVQARYGVEPSSVPDFIALRGDPSDGLPGAPGVGAKTAAELLRRHGTLERVLVAAADSAAGQGLAERVPPRTAAALLGCREQLEAFKQIATLQRIEGVAPPPDRDTDFAAGAVAAAALGMRRLAERLERSAATA